MIPPSGRTVTLGETMGLFSAQASLLLESHPQFHLSVGGAETNVAIGLTRLGHATTWVGRLGNDSVGEFIERELQAEGVRTLGLSGPGHTGLMVRSQQGFDRLRVQYARANSAGSRLSPADIPVDEIRAARLLHLTGITAALGQEPRDAMRLAVESAESAGVPISLDLNYRAGLWDTDDARRVLLEFTAQADIVFATTAEARILLGSEGDAAAAHTDDVARDLELARGIRALGPREVVVKRGADGAVSVAETGEFDQNVTHVVERDPVGAGDAFAAGYLSGVLHATDPQERLDFAGRVAAHSVTIIGDWEGLPRATDLAPRTADILR